MNVRDERLKKFFGTYFHQDWDVRGAAVWQDVIRFYVSRVQRPVATELRDDLRAWLAEGAGDPSPSLPPEFGCDYDPRGDELTDWHWVEQIVAELERLVQN